MSEFDSSKDYYDILGAAEKSSRRELHRQYKRLASLYHPDRGGNEDSMKALNEAYSVLKDDSLRRDYDFERKQSAPQGFVPTAQAPARDVGAAGQALSAFMCLLMGLFLLVLVRAQWIWFLWPLAILALLAMAFGVLLTHGAMLSFNETLPKSNPIRRYRLLQETMFWSLVLAAGYGIYLLVDLRL